MVSPIREERVPTEAVVVPLVRPVRTASGTVDRAPLVLIDLVTSDGVVGHAYLFSYYPWMGRSDPPGPGLLAASADRKALRPAARSSGGVTVAGLTLAVSRM